MAAQTDIMEKIVALCRRRGFIFGSSEIYGGIGGFWDYGPLGTELKRNIKDAWWNDMVRNPPSGPNGIEYQMVGLDCSIIMNPKVWEASGHAGGFSDPMIACKNEGCKRLFRADKLFIRAFYDSGDDLYREEIVSQIQGVKSSDKQIAVQLANDPTLSVPKVLFTVEGESVDDVLVNFPFASLSNTQRSKFKGNPRDAIWPLVLGRQAAWPVPRCPKCNGELTEPRAFNLMFESHTGALQDSSSKVYLRPETAQGIFVNFKNVIDTTRVKVPFGIAQIGKAFRNEINPRNYTFRSREFEQMEIEFFCHPSEAPMWYEYWRDLRYQWCVGLGLKSDKLRLRDHEKDELAHYADACADIEYAFPFGVSELEGIANRTDFDLKAHQKHSKKDLTYFDDVRKERFTPYVIEPSAGVDRFALAVICEAYTYNESRASPEFMKFHPRLAPIKAAVFPLVNKDGMPEIAEPMYREIKKHFPCQYDARQAIGRRYARMDEAGTPFCFTIDGQTKEDGTVTVRDRNDASQIRIDKSQCLQYLRDKLTL